MISQIFFCLYLFVMPSNAQNLSNRHLDSVQGWFESPTNTIIFIISLFTLIVTIMVIMLVYKMNPNCRNSIKGICKKKKIVVDEETKKQDWEKYVGRLEVTVLASIS